MAEPAMPLFTGAERRQQARASLSWSLVAQTSAGMVRGRTINVSREGVLVTLEASLPANGDLTLALELDDPVHVIVAKADIIRRVSPVANQAVHIYALRLRDISEYDQRFFSGNLAPEWQQPGAAAAADGQAGQVPPSPQSDNCGPDGERRRHSRASLAWPVTVDTGTTVLYGQAMDISQGGLLLLLETQLAQEQALRLAIEVVELPYVILAEGEVVRPPSPKNLADGPPYVYGLRFSHLDEQDRSFFSGNLAPEWLS